MIILEFDIAHSMSQDFRGASPSHGAGGCRLDGDSLCLQMMARSTTPSPPLPLPSLKEGIKTSRPRHCRLGCCSRAQSRLPQRVWPAGVYCSGLETWSLAWRTRKNEPGTFAHSATTTPLVDFCFFTVNCHTFFDSGALHLHSKCPRYHSRDTPGPDGNDRRFRLRSWGKDRHSWG